MEVPDKNGKPLITNEMKADCIGEFQMTIQTGCFVCMGKGCECCDQTGDGEQGFDVPWNLMKAIYKRMALVASQSMQNV